MKSRFLDLLRIQGTIGRGAYTVYGLVLFAVKYNLDRIVASYYHQQLTPWNYLFPAQKVPAILSQSEDSKFYLTLMILALPFIWVGTTLTLRRLRSIGFPPWLVLVFFIPILNLLFFLILCLTPSKEDPAVNVSGSQKLKIFLDRVIPDSSWGSAGLGILLNVLSAFLFTQFSVQTLTKYGWGLFVGLPFSLGFTSVLIYTYHWHQSLGNCLKVAIISVALAGILFFVMAVEGFACLLMAAPLAILLSMIGGAIAYAIQSRPDKKSTFTQMYSSLIIAIPFVMGMEADQGPVPQVHEVRTAVEIHATPEQVWKHVVSFSQIAPPREYLFRVGIAYPVRAAIYGSGAGAVRHCIFSTGEFVEPITVWNEPALLKFSVTSNPPPMQEWTLYSRVHPPHLKDFLVSKGGQFRLIRLTNGRTLLEGTTWYQHNMQPELYWKIWSDQSIHTIHMRVLNHVKSLAEAQVNTIKADFIHEAW